MARAKRKRRPTTKQWRRAFARPTRDDVAKAFKPTNRSLVVVTRKRRLAAICAMTANKLLPETVRLQFAERWRLEQEALEREEFVRSQYTWRAMWRRLVDRIVGALNPPEPKPMRYPFEG